MTLSNCPACSGLLVPDDDEFRCVNCGRRFSSGQPSNDHGRTCRDCNVDIVALPPNVVRCLSCRGLANDTASALKNLKTELKPWEEPEAQPVPEPDPEPKTRPSEPMPEPVGSPLAKPSPRMCQDCKADISGRSLRSLRCVDCQEAAEKASMAEVNQETHRRRQEKFGTNLVECPVCGRKFSPGRGLQTHQRRSHADSSTPPKGATRSCQDCKADISERPWNCVRCVDCQKAADKAVVTQSNLELSRRRQEKRRSHEPVEPAEPAGTSAESESESEYTPTQLDNLVDQLLKERSFGGKGHTISGMGIVAVYIDAMIIVAESTHQEAQKDLAALCRIKELLADNQDETAKQEIPEQIQEDY